MALIATLYDLFTGGSLDAQWASGPTPSGGAVDCVSGSNPLVSAAAYTFEGSEIIIKLTAGDTGTWHSEDAHIAPLSPGATFMGLARTTGSNWNAAQFNSSYVLTGSFASFGAGSPWAKMTFPTAGTVMYYHSADGVSWTHAYTYSGANGSPLYDGKALRLNYVIFDQVGQAAAPTAVRRRQVYQQFQKVLPRLGFNPSSSVQMGATKIQGGAVVPTGGSNQGKFWYLRRRRR